MKRPVFILRLGKPQLFKADEEAMMTITGGYIDDGEIHGCTVKAGILSLLMTDASLSDIAEAHNKTNDWMPIVAWEANSKTTAFDLDLPQVQSMIEAFCEENEITNLFGNECTLSMDELLDKIARVGESGLSEEEFSRLKYLTNNL